MGAWIEIYKNLQISWKFQCRTPRWVRGLKFIGNRLKGRTFLVAPHDGCVDWNVHVSFKLFVQMSRTPRWVRGLKSFSNSLWNTTSCRTPRWVRGLKYYSPHIQTHLVRSHPTMGAWIEIHIFTALCINQLCRTPRWVRGLKSQHAPFLSYAYTVAPHDGCVDWNLSFLVQCPL